jgi:protein-tyrosine phosphatase
MEGISSVLPGILYISSHEPAKDREQLRELEILHVVRLGQGEDFEFYYRTHEDIVYHDIYIDDSHDADLTEELLDQATEFIHFSCGPVLVHCFAGISRSASIVIAYLMRFRKMSMGEAWSYLIERHPRACPNIKFQDDLDEYAKTLNAEG